MDDGGAGAPDDRFYGWTSLFLVAGVFLWWIFPSIHAVFYRSRYKSRGEDQGICFSDVATVSSYVPEVKSKLFSYPLLAVNTGHVDEELYEWNDPDKPYSYYDLTRDAREVLKDCMRCRKRRSIRSLAH